MLATQLLSGAGAASATIATDEQAAAQLAENQGYRTGIGVLDLQTGQYVGAGDDTGNFASESVAKILIATDLLKTGQMTGTVETMAYQMITQSDDDDADALYGLAGGDQVIELVAKYYDIPFLGTPPSQPGWWGNTEINAKGMVYLYQDIAKDPQVGPWLMNAMAHATEYGADGTYQFFGLPSATTGAAIKQGWGDDGDDSPNAVFNSTGYVDDDHYAVAILTDGNTSTYGSTISDMVTQEAKRLMPNGKLDDPAAHNPAVTITGVSASGSSVHITGTAIDPDAATTPLQLAVYEGSTEVWSGAATGTSFAVDFLAPDGQHTYQVTADNLGAGDANTSAAVKPVTVDGDPTGTVSSVHGGPGDVTLQGVLHDPNQGDSQSARVEVSVDGHSPVTDQVTLAPATGDYRLVVPASAGSHQVAVTYVASSAGDGTNVAEGTFPVTVAKVPTPPADHKITREVLSSTGIGLVPLGGLILLLRRRSRSGRHHRLV